MRKVIAIDGPAASGKSSVSRRLADKIDFICVNSGNFYRALTWQLLTHSIDLHHAGAVNQFLTTLQWDVRIQNQKVVLFINGEEIGDHLHADAVNTQVSMVAALPPVRTFLLQKLRSLADDKDIVMEGRDIGTVVFPTAWKKFYLDASPEVRHQRRLAQGINDQISQRDRIDSSRKIAPLKIADDACVIDTSTLDIDGVVDQILKEIEKSPLCSNSRSS